MKRNPIRGTTALDVGNLDDYEWTKLKPRMKPRKSLTEILNRHRDNCLQKLRKLDEQFADAELNYLRNRCKELEAVVAADRVLIDRENAVEAELKRIQTYYKTEQDKEDLKRQDKAKKILSEINADIVKSEREALLKRGVVRGRRT